MSTPPERLDPIRSTARSFEPKAKTCQNKLSGKPQTPTWGETDLIIRKDLVVWETTYFIGGGGGCLPHVEDTCPGGLWPINFLVGD